MNQNRNGHRAEARLAAVLLAGLSLLPAARALESGEALCGSLQNAYGPFDYRVYKDRSEIKRVDEYHFTPLVENLIKPMFQHFAGDFDYTLRASPNHHRALISMVRWSEKVKNPQPPGAGRTVDCYFDRAFRFAPDDMIPRMIFAGHLGRTGRTADAIAQLDFVVKSAGDNAFTHYNAGLTYLEIAEYGKALAQAHKSAELGLPRTELRDRLKAAGKWVESDGAAPPATAEAGQPAASAAATHTRQP